MKLARVGNKSSHGRACYASGGRVAEDLSDPGSLPDVMSGPSKDEGLGIDGGKAKPRLDRAGKKASPVSVNVIVTSGKSEPTPAMPLPNAGPPVPPPAMGPPPGGPPPMPMRASGGRVMKNMDAGAGGGLGRLEKAKAYGDKPAKGK
jgi:hypothetical protein